jgi:hypothetical protein
MLGSLLHAVGQTSIFEMKLEAEVLRDILTLFSGDERVRMESPFSCMVCN